MLRISILYFFRPINFKNQGSKKQFLLRHPLDLHLFDYGLRRNNFHIPPHGSTTHYFFVTTFKTTHLGCFAGIISPLTHFFVESQGSKKKFTHSHKNFFFHQNKDLTQATFTQLLNLPILPKAEKLFTPFLIFSFSTSLRFTSL